MNCKKFIQKFKMNDNIHPNGIKTITHNINNAETIFLTVFHLR